MTDDYYAIRYEIYMPRAVQIFYGKYPDHPLVTGINVYPLVTKTSEGKMADMVAVNAEINAFDSQADSFDRWRFLSAQGITAGDCEDKAITKAERLLERGWSVSDLKLEGGSYWYPDPIDQIYKPKSHLWLVANGYALDNGVVSSSVTTRAAMYAAYPSVRMVQVSANTWTTIADSPANTHVWWNETYEFTVTPVPHDQIDLPILRFNHKITQKL